MSLLMGHLTKLNELCDAAERALKTRTPADAQRAYDQIVEYASTNLTPLELELLLTGFNHDEETTS